MEYEIDEIGVLLDPSTNPSIIRRRAAASRLHRPVPAKPCQKAVVIPEEEEQLS